MRRPQHNFERKWRAVLRWLGISSASTYSLHCFHDQECEFFTGGYCNCDPDMRMLRSDVDEGARE